MLTTLDRPERHLQPPGQLGEGLAIGQSACNRPEMLRGLVDHALGRIAESHRHTLRLRADRLAVRLKDVL